MPHPDEGGEQVDEAEQVALKRVTKPFGDRVVSLGTFCSLMLFLSSCVVLMITISHGSELTQNQLIAAEFRNTTIEVGSDDCLVHLYMKAIDSCLEAQSTLDVKSPDGSQVVSQLLCGDASHLEDEEKSWMKAHEPGLQKLGWFASVTKQGKANRGVYLLGNVVSMWAFAYCGEDYQRDFEEYAYLIGIFVCLLCSAVCCAIPAMAALFAALQAPQRYAEFMEEDEAKASVLGRTGTLNSERSAASGGGVCASSTLPVGRLRSVDTPTKLASATE